MRGRQSGNMAVQISLQSLRLFDNYMADLCAALVPLRAQETVIIALPMDLATELNFYSSLIEKKGRKE